MTTHSLRLIAREIFQDIKPAPRLQNREKIFIDVIGKKNIRSFCKKNNDLVALKNMLSHELTKEPCEKVIAICSCSHAKHSSKQFRRFLKNAGFKTDSWFSSNHKENISGVMNINGFVIPGWAKLVGLIRIFSSRAAIFFGRQYAPGKSRLHIRTFEGISRWYIIAHVDEYNWIHPNLWQAKKHHLGSGRGNYKLGHKLMIKLLRFYLRRKHKMFHYQ